MTTSLNSRAQAAAILVHVLPFGRQNASLRSLSDILPKQVMHHEDASLVKELCFGVCRWYSRLDKLSSPLVKQPFKTKDIELHALLLIGLYQMLYLRIPDHAAISETVEACRQLNKTWAVNVINGMLRTAQRSKTTLLQDLPDNHTITHAHPKWLVDALSAAWPEQVEGILKANNIPGALCLRVNLSKIKRDAYLRLLKEANITSHAGTMTDSAVYLEKATDVTELPGFSDGLVSVQDEAAQLSAILLDPQAGERILDACAAPGGKTGHILELQPNLKLLIALDADENRLKRVAENLNRLQLSAEMQHSSLEDLAELHQGPKFDRILLDAPCSATGVIRRHPDIKWLRKRSDISRLANTQLKLLECAFSLLKPGGTLLYATCSILPQENSRTIHQFLKQQPQAIETPISLIQGTQNKVGLQLFPTVNNHDGFYYAQLNRLN